ncbi:MAG: hypothetical protein U5N56_09970 [Candidatus Marinimicrobia bacterium]|nr:hypothetical protein [Candidatus Neomarinimicrobiota bacterium]
MKNKQQEQIEKWYADHKDPPPGPDRDRNLYLSPPKLLSRRNPSLIVFRKILDAFSRLYDDWEKVFAERGLPCDLQLWVYDEHMTDSRLLCFGMDHSGEKYPDNFLYSPEQYKFQYGKYPKGEYFDPDGFDWTTYEVRSCLFEKSDRLSKRRIRKLLKRGWYKGPHSRH